MGGGTDLFYIEADVHETILQDLTEGQQVWVEPYEMDYAASADPAIGMISWFSGHLISAS